MVWVRERAELGNGNYFDEVHALFESVFIYRGDGIRNF